MRARKSILKRNKATKPIRKRHRNRNLRYYLQFELVFNLRELKFRNAFVIRRWRKATFGLKIVKNRKRKWKKHSKLTQTKCFLWILRRVFIKLHLVNWTRLVRNLIKQ